MPGNDKAPSFRQFGRGVPGFHHNRHFLQSSLLALASKRQERYGQRADYVAPYTRLSAQQFLHILGPKESGRSAAAFGECPTAKLEESFFTGLWHMGHLTSLSACSTTRSWPVAVYPIYRLLLPVARLLGAINTWLLLGAVFFGILLPVGWVLRRLGRLQYQTLIDPDADSYRIDVPRDHTVRLKEPF